MATDKPRITAYLSPENSRRLKEYMQSRHLSESKAVDAILSAYFEGNAPSSTLEIESSAPARESNLPSALLDQVRDIVDAANSQLEAKIEAKILGESKA